VHPPIPDLSQELAAVLLPEHYTQKFNHPDPSTSATIDHINVF